MLQGLADKMVAKTQVHVEVRDAVSLEDPQLLQVPFVLLTVDTPFEFTDSEAANLGAYLTGDGVLLVERVCTPLGRGSKWFLRPPGTIRVCSATSVSGFAPWMKRGRGEDVSGLSSELGLRDKLRGEILLRLKCRVVSPAQG